MPRRVTESTVICNVVSVTSARVELDCGHSTNVPVNAPMWLIENLAHLNVGDEQICSECVEQEITRERETGRR